MPSVSRDHSYRAFDSEKPCLVASTVIAFLDIARGNRRDSPPAPSSLPEHWAEAAENEALLRPPPEEQTKTPSLVEIAHHACYKSPQLSQLPFLLPKEDCPFHLSELLQKTWKLKEAGGQSCSVCNSNYIVPRTEWVEWWYCSPSYEAGPVPFLRRGGSW